MTSNAIYTYVTNKVRTRYPTIYRTSVYDIVTESLPCISVREINRSVPRQNITLDFTDNQYRVSFETTVYCDTKDEAYAIMSLAETAFRELYFIETMCEPIDNADKSIFRLVARFEKQMGS